MDTIQIAIKLNENRVRGISYEVLQEASRFINSIKSSHGHTYCDCLEISTTGNLIIKISYPRFFEGINAYLITSSIECMQVQYEFCLAIWNYELLRDAEIILNRVDIPFTFMVGPNYSFNSYKKVYQVFNYIYKRKNQKASPKAFTDIEKFRVETLIYADTSNIASYNSKITIYDQYNNIKAKTGDEGALYDLERKYEDLCKRMRIEVSKRIQRKGFTIEEFRQFDIFREYSEKYKKYILDNILDLNEVENFYSESAFYLANRLLTYREESNNFNYENFIYREIENIYDYEIIRRALKICIDNSKTREKAITAIRKVLFRYQLDENMIIMETYKTIEQIRNVINQYFIF